MRNRLTSLVYLSQLLGQRAEPLCDLSSFPLHFGQQGTIRPGIIFHEKHRHPYEQETCENTDFPGFRGVVPHQARTNPQPIRN